MSFRTSFAENIFRDRYALTRGDTWPALAKRVIQDVCADQLARGELEQLEQYITDMKFIPGGRYLRFAGRNRRFWNNCYCLRVEDDTREEWREVVWRALGCLMTGGGIGVDYNVIRPARSPLSSGGECSGPISLMRMVNEAGREVMQGGARRSAIYASINWQHPDAEDFIHAKDWSEDVRTMKDKDQSFPAALDMTNISLNYDDAFLQKCATRVPYFWYEAIRQMLKTGEPGCSFNFGENENETLRNACTEITSEDDSDVCNLGSVNMSRIKDLAEFKDVCYLGAKFLVCGSKGAELPYQKVIDVRAKNRRIGLGLMGIHEWLLQRGYSYEVTDELHSWLGEYREYSERGGNDQSDRLDQKKPIKYRAIAPTGTIGIIASTTTGIEPVFAVAYKRRYLSPDVRWKYEYVIDATADYLIRQFELDPAKIDTAYSLSEDPELRVQFQYDVQKYVDHAISSTINLPAWGTSSNNDGTVREFADMLLKYAHGLRGITVYPDGARGGQPLTEVPYDWAMEKRGHIYDESEEKCAGGVCGM